MMNTKQTSVQEWINEISIGHTQETTFQFITNADKSIRWIWPSTNKKPVFLKLYSASSLKAKLYVLFIKTLFLLRLQSLIVKKDIASFDGFLSGINTDCTREWALFTGTIGPNRKMIIAGKDFGDVSCFTKIALTNDAKDLVKNEVKAIDYLTSKKVSNTTLPSILSRSENHIQLSDISGGKRSQSLTTVHIQSLKEIQEVTRYEGNLSITPIYRETLDTFRELSSNKNQAVPKAMKRKLQWLLNDISEYSSIELNFAHRDFTPWNCYLNDNSLALYDLELGWSKLPKGFDAFHYIIQNGILINRSNWNTIYSEIKKTICPAFFDNDEAAMKRYLKFYLLINTTYYLDIYAKQEQWHTQVTWLLDTWNDALSFILSDVNSHRKLVLMDTFDFMQNREYAALKFKGYLPEQISELSDVDLCTSEEDAEALTEYLKSHSLANIVRTKRLSFMTNVELVLNNSELLSIDAIWKLKRKNLLIQDISKLINSTTTNVFGIKQPNSLAEAEYVNHFYALNKAATPMAYKSASFELEIEKLAKSNKPVAIQKTLISMLRKKKENKGFSFIKNSIEYVLDTLKNAIKQRGFIVTFSGVDGAGKSTLIEITKQRIDKQLRKPVVVLRHRPSVLPIISAWTMGKQAAEQKAATTLPRLGENSSTLSSLARFAYYYTDYLLGQFYVYGKYVLRGKVVLYDRYYFDFINDSKRSNISLPKCITTLGYAFIMKPDVNFFLYADAETILARKQELDAATIEELTSKYLSLFEKLNKKTSTKRYHSVKNIQLTDTVDAIMTQLKLQVA